MNKRLHQLRKKVEQIDYKIISLLTQRQKLAPHFAKIKLELGLPFHQQQREQELLKRYKQIAAKNNISTKLIIKIFPHLFHASLREQRQFLKKKD